MPVVTVESEDAMIKTVAILTLAICAPAQAQISMRPTPPPAVTAESEDWYASGAPIVIEGNFYHQSGPVMHFNRNEMVRTGWLGRIPLYIRTTQEPRSIVYVPLGGGVVRPYERRRDGELAGTVGSRVPSFPVTLPSAEDREVAFPVRAPAPPTGVPVAMRGDPGEARAGSAAPGLEPAVIGTTGAGLIPPQPVDPTPLETEPARIETVRLPVGLNGVFIEFDSTRWFADGPVVEFSPGRFTVIGDYHGFVVYAATAYPGAVFVPTVTGEPGLLTPYRPR